VTSFTAVDTVRALSGLGADLNLQDNNGLTALHWAVDKGKLKVVSELLERGARIDIKDCSGLDAEAFSEGKKQKKITAFIKRWRFYKFSPLSKYQWLHRLILFVLPGVALLANLLLVAALPAIKAFIGIIAVWLLLAFTARAFWPLNGKKPFSFGIVVGTLTLLFVVFGVWLVPLNSEHDFLLIAFIISFYCCCHSLYLSWKCDPGFIREAEVIRLTEIITRAEEEKIGEAHVCYTCLLLKPTRSKHCSQCGECVRLFDHHCPFINNCVGGRNHRYFIGFLIFLPLGSYFYLCLCINYLRHTCMSADSKSVLSMQCLHAETVVCWAGLTAAFHGFWVFFMNLSQLYQVPMAWNSALLRRDTKARVFYVDYGQFNDQ
jgi:hypothetical protein